MIAIAPARRRISRLGGGPPRGGWSAANLTDEPAVLASFAETAADPDHPPAGVVIFIGHDPLDSTDRQAALKRSRDSIWYVSSAVRAIVGGWHGRSPRLWLVTRRGLAVRRRPGGSCDLRR